jgi:CBS domain-containing membrane protein
MTREVVCLRQEQDILVAHEVMALGKLRHLPVIDRMGHYVGLITHREIVMAWARALAAFSPVEASWFGRGRLGHGIPAGEVMLTEVLPIEPRTSAGEAARRIAKGRFGCLPVVNKDKLVGILTEADLLTLVIEALEGQSLAHEQSLREADDLATGIQSQEDRPSDRAPAIDPRQ